MTIEARATLPAGWYTDPGASGGKRWWDGTKWTEHVQMPVKPPPPSVTARSLSNPYGLNGVSAAPRTPMTGETQPLYAAESSKRGGNAPGWICLPFGLAALGFTTLNTLPGPQAIWILGAAAVAIVLGFVALTRHRAHSATVAWAPILGMLLGLAATVSMVSGVSVMSVINSLGPQTAPQAKPVAIVVQTTSPEPITFPGNQQLTTAETAAQSLATALNRNYAAGNSSLANGQAWPRKLTMQGDGAVAADGAQLTTLPDGLTASYQLSADKASYLISVTKPGTSELATYSSSANAFSWSCLASDIHCTPAS